MNGNAFPLRMATTLNVVLNVTNVGRSERFYRKLGFETARRTEGGVEYVEASLGGAVVSLFPKDSPWADEEVRDWLSGPLGAGVVLYFETPEVERVWRAAKKARARIELALDTEQGERAFMMDDPDGYVLFFGEPEAKARTKAPRKRRAGAPARRAAASARR